MKEYCAVNPIINIEVLPEHARKMTVDNWCTEAIKIGHELCAQCVPELAKPITRRPVTCACDQLSIVWLNVSHLSGHRYDKAENLVFQVSEICMHVPEFLKFSFHVLVLSFITCQGWRSFKQSMKQPYVQAASKQNNLTIYMWQRWKAHTLLTFKD